MHSRLLFSSLSSLLLITAACGDDKGGESATESPTTGMSTTSATTESPTTGSDTTGTPTTSTTAEPTTTSSPTTSMGGTTGMGACDTQNGDEDADGDGVANKGDNCPCDPNPNQLDFDADAVGNVCADPLIFQVINGTPPEFNKLDTKASAGMGPLSCNFDVGLIAIGGDVQVTLDDQGTGMVYVNSLSFADAKNLVCDLVILNVKLDIQMLMTKGDMPFMVGFPFTVADHDMGMVTGMMDKPHTMLVNGTINITESSNPDLAPPGPAPLMDVPGQFPPGVVTVTNAGKDVKIDFADKDSLMLMQTTMTGITIKLTGLTGTLQMTM